MKITSLTISTDRTQLNLTITDATNVSALKLWTDSTYKDYSLAIDLSAKLTGSATENIVITLADLSLSYFDGVYFVEAEDPDEVSIGIVGDLTRYKECILNKVIVLQNCNDCLKEVDVDLLNAHTLLQSLEIAIENGFIDEIITIINALDVFCSNTCKSCGEYQNTIDTNYYSV